MLDVPITPLWTRARRDAPNRGREGFRHAVQTALCPRITAFKPDLLLFSAGFDGADGDDGNAQDDVQGLDLTANDFEWATAKLCAAAKCPTVSVLEGGYGAWSKEEGKFERASLAACCMGHALALARYAGGEVQPPSVAALATWPLISAEEEALVLEADKKKKTSRPGSAAPSKPPSKAPSRAESKANSKRASPMVSPLRDAAAAAAVPQMGDVMGSMSAPRPSPDEGAKPAAPAAAASAAAPDTEEEEETPPLPTSPTLAGVAGSILGSPQRLAAAAVNAASAAPAMASSAVSWLQSLDPWSLNPAAGAPATAAAPAAVAAPAARQPSDDGGLAAAQARLGHTVPASAQRRLATLASQFAALDDEELETEDPRRSSVGHERWETPEQPRPPPPAAAQELREEIEGIGAAPPAATGWSPPAQYAPAPAAEKQSSLNSTTSDDATARSTSQD